MAIKKVVSCKHCAKQFKTSGKRTIICSDCRRKARLKAARNFRNKIKTSKEHFVRSTYATLSWAVRNRYKNKYAFDFSADQLVNFSLNDIEFIKLYDHWQKNKYQIRLTPSLTRLDKEANFTLTNICWLPRQVNCSRSTKKVSKYFGVTINFYGDEKQIKYYTAQLRISGKKIIRRCGIKSEKLAAIEADKLLVENGRLPINFPNRG